MLFLSSLAATSGPLRPRRGVMWTQTASMILAFVLAGLTLSGAIHDARGAWSSFSSRFWWAL